MTEGKTGTTIAHKKFDFVKNHFNCIEEVKTDNSLATLAALSKKALEVDESEVDYYVYDGVRNIASYAPVKSAGWTVFVKAPVEEFEGTIQVLRRTSFKKNPFLDWRGVFYSGPCHCVFYCVKNGKTY